MCAAVVGQQLLCVVILKDLVNEMLSDCELLKPVEENSGIQYKHNTCVHFNTNNASISAENMKTLMLVLYFLFERCISHMTFGIFNCYLNDIYDRHILFPITPTLKIRLERQNRSTEGCSKLKRSVDMTSSGKNGLNIRTNASPKWDRTRCPEE